MADLKRTIEILFEGHNNTGTAITAVGRGLDNLNYQVASVAQPFADFTGAVVKLDAALAGLAAAGLAYAFNESSKLQSSFTELKKVAGDNVDVLNIAKAGAKDLSNTYGTAASDILASTANYVQAGFNVQESMGLARTGMDLVIAGGVDASQASEILIASLKGFREPATEAARLLDILNEVSNNYATDTEQLGIGMAALSPIARTMGFSMEETAGILTPVIEIFRSGDEAAVALKTGLLKLIDDSAPVKAALASIGVSQTDANGALRSGKDILQDVSKAFLTLDGNQKLFVTQQLVGIHQSARMVEVFDNLGKSSEITAVAMNAAGSAAKEVAVRLADPEVAVNRLIQGFKNLASSVGDDFQVAGTGAVNGITSIFNSLEGAVGEGAFDPLLDALNHFLEGVGTDLEAFAESLPAALEGVDYTGFLDSLGELKDVIGGLFDSIDFDKPETLTAAIQKVVDTFESITRMSAGIGKVFVDIGGYISSLIGWFDGLDEDTKTLIGTVSGVGAAISLLSGPIGTAAIAIKGLGAAVSLLTASPVVAGVLAVGAAVYGITKASDAAADAMARWAGKNELAKESLAFAKETDEDIARIYAEANKVIPAMEGMGKASYAGNLAIVQGMGESYDATKSLTEQMRDLGILVEEKKTVNIDTKEAEQKLQSLEIWRESTGTWETIKVPVDTTQIDKAKKAIDEIPAAKRLEIETDFQIAVIKSQAEVIQSALKFKAEVDTAEIKAAAEVTKAVTKNISDMFIDTGKSITGLFSMLGGDNTISQDNAIDRAISEETENRKALLAQQKELNDVNVKYLKAKTKKMQSGDALITVNGDGLQPHLEMIMWELFAAIQIRTAEDGLDALLFPGSVAP